MRYFSLVMFIILHSTFISFSEDINANSPLFNPNWKIGMTWEVCVWCPQRYIMRDELGSGIKKLKASQEIYKYRVDEIVIIEGIKCFKLTKLREIPKESYGNETKNFSIAKRVYYYDVSNYNIVGYYDFSLSNKYKTNNSRSKIFNKINPPSTNFDECFPDMTSFKKDIPRNYIRQEIESIDGCYFIKFYTPNSRNPYCIVKWDVGEPWWSEMKLVAKFIENKFEDIYVAERVLPGWKYDHIPKWDVEK